MNFRKHLSLEPSGGREETAAIGALALILVAASALSAQTTSLSASRLTSNLAATKTTSALAAPALGVAAPSGALAPAAADDDSDGRTPPSPEIQKLAAALLERALPKWDSRLLTSYETPTDWSGGLSRESVLKLLDDEPFAWEGEMKPPPEAERFVDPAKALRFSRQDGFLRYQSRMRAFSPDWRGKPVPDEGDVGKRMGALLTDLKFPLGETRGPEYQVQEVALGDESGETSERFPVYAFFLLNREVEGIPVEGSTVRAALNARGEVQRLKVAWPAFRVRREARLISREQVVDQALQQVLAQDPTEKMEVASRLVYARSDKGDYLPAVQVDVMDGETPYRLTVPVAQ